MPLPSGLTTHSTSLKAIYKKYVLKFKLPGGTSRGVLTEKETWFLVLEENGKTGIGECSPLKGLSIDDRPDYEDRLKWVCENIHLGKDALWNELLDFPSIQFGIETAFISLSGKNPFLLFPSEFTEGKKNIPINGLIWMGDTDTMRRQIDERISQGFNCIKLKIGALDFEKELQLLAYIRNNYDESQIELRVDANGAFDSDSTLCKLTQLSEFKLHSIEQPLRKNQHDSLSVLCDSSNLAIALDEELIGISDPFQKAELLQKIRPKYVVLKPSLLGGFRGTREWISAAEKLDIGWWITSALESNIGLNAIAQWTYLLKNPMHQGLGTGSLFTNNFESPLEVSKGYLHYNKEKDWKVDFDSLIS